MAKTNMFTAAKAAPAPVKAKAKADKETVQMDGLEGLAALTALIKNLEAVKSTIEAEVKAEQRAHFIEHGAKNFIGVDGIATASIECRKRSTTSVLSDAEVEALEAADIPVGSIEVMPERFVVNPDKMSDQKLLQRVSDALSKIPGTEDFIMLQEGVTKSVVTEETFAKATETKDLRSQFISTVAVMAVKPKLDGEVDVAKLLDMSKALLGVK